MNVEGLHDYCLSKKGVTAEFPFDVHTLVFKVLGKVFAITGLERSPFAVNLKCEPSRAIELREENWEIEPGYHMNKKHWNTINFEGDLEETFLRELIDHSYELVIQKLKKSDREILENV